MVTLVILRLVSLDFLIYALKLHGFGFFDSQWLVDSILFTRVVKAQNFGID